MNHTFNEGIHAFLSLYENYFSSSCSLGNLLTALKFSVGDEGFLRVAWFSRAKPATKYGVPALPSFILVENKEQVNK
jgi:hypothetical protein